MPAAKKKTAGKTGSAAKKTAPRKKGAAAVRKDDTYREDRRFWSVIVFIVGIFIGFVTIIEGTGAWLAIHDFLRGIFGLGIVLFAPFLIYLGVMLALDKPRRWFHAKLFQATFFLLLLCGLFLIIADSTVKGSTALAVLQHLFYSGVELKGGGVFGAVFGLLLLKAFGKTGALIVSILLLVGFLILLTNLTVVEIFALLTKPFRKGYSAAREERAERISALDTTDASDRKPKKEPRKKENPDKNARVDIAKYYGAETAAEQEDNAESAFRPLSDKKHNSELDMAFPKGKASYFDKFKREQASEDDAPPFDVPEQTQEPENATEKQPESTPRKRREPAMKKTVYVENDGQTTLFEKTTADNIYLAPPVSLLKYPTSNADVAASQAEIRLKSETLVDTLKSFGVQTRIVDIHRGPSVTRYELQPAAGVKVSKITGLADDIALNLAAEGVRIEAPIPGKAAVGIEIANKHRDSVSIRELIDSQEYRAGKGRLTFAVGKDIEGKIIMGDITKMPHLLIAGTTGSGKSVFTNSIIMNILYKASPSEVKLILIDPKQVEFPIYNGIPHLLIPVVTEARKAAGALGWAVNEMMRRYKMFSDTGVRDIYDYNDMAQTKEELEFMPQMVIVVDELADLMMAAPKEVEDSICRIAQLARAAGMHLIIATQSPRVDVVTGLIKANIPSRVALKVSNQIDSRVILDEGGAEKLLGQGDMLYKPVGLGKPVRIQGSYVPTKEVRAVVEFLKNQEKAVYDEEVLGEIETCTPVPKGEKSMGGEDTGLEGTDDMVEDAINVITESGQASTSYLQRRLKLGYARAARIMDELEQLGVVGEAQGAKPRKVLLTREQWLERQALK